MSQNNQTLSNEAPKASRRAILTAAPAVAAGALLAAAVTNAVAIGVAKAGEVDPIFGAIEDHRTAVALMRALEDADGDEEEIDDQFYGATEALIEADLVLLSTSPTTVTGVVAALEYAGSGSHFYRERVTVLQQAGGWTRVDVKDAARDFPALVAAALRNIVERGRA
jgi:hypothetical protein